MAISLTNLLIVKFTYIFNRFQGHVLYIASNLKISKGGLTE